MAARTCASTTTAATCKRCRRKRQRAAWCITCKANELAALRSARLAQAFETHNVAYLEGDWTNRDDAIAAELAAHGRAGVPLYLYYPPGGEPRVLPQVLTESLMIETIEGDAQ